MLGIITTNAGKKIRRLVRKRKEEQYENYVAEIEEKGGPAAIKQTGEDEKENIKAVLIPIHKNGAHVDPGNYRPISLLSQSRKINETALDSAVRKHYSNHWIQFGFQKGDELQLTSRDIASMIDREPFKKALEHLNRNSTPRKIREIFTTQ